MKRNIFAVLALALAAPACSEKLKAQNDAELIAAQYGISFTQQFLGKVIRGENILQSFQTAASEAVPSAAFQYAGMKMVGANWQFAIPAQLLTQKGAWVQRQSMLGRPIFGREFLTTWELDYLWFNLRVRDGRMLLPRLNPFTVFVAAEQERQSVFWKESLVSGAVIYKATRDIDALGKHADNVIVIQHVAGNWGSVLSHELTHSLQRVRGHPLFDVVLHQDASQKRFLPFLRVDLGGLWMSAYGRNFFPKGGDNFLEWEVDGYVY
ncbi:MAG: hypothetical protein UY26_C0003G0301 [Candidatus Jorgensenbacteria bacterium GW2011_GWA1_48_13]|uniref:Lipoprotein n=2 Tax=Candidatus Joergenseniibacteriota TaxID=1752739 RepID=A0A0G1W7R3_9BACT|nr:MAG: hypothetical protein UY26_C0003G0301 [Candidatus Jorgensenbacteria bacterium GW2011_GWA1_48_13]KKU99240.1 MAG: hypothetical protein UY32_C0003G0010 [Candidatus Jorgensenbacteria bacterium GW2011_GWC1_48_8]KKW14811.1 MAG: hypothetical protein UY55_C0003G0027 [Candidatus Jorgensenbacteria bacterium GW2011_GWB1_50_10]